MKKSNSDTKNEKEILLNTLDRFELLSITRKEGVWEYNCISKKSYYSKGMTSLFGYSLSEMEDNNAWWQTNIHPQDKLHITFELENLLKGNKNIWWAQYQFLCKNGRYKNVIDRIYVVRDKNNKPIRLIGSMQDLSEINDLREETEKLNKIQHNTMVREIFRSGESERKMISEELHENVNQVLAATNIMIGHAKKHISKDGLAWLLEAETLIKDSIDGIRHIANRLSPLALKSTGMYAAIESLLKTLSEKKKIRYTITIDKKTIAKIDPEIQLILFRVVQIQILNILNHSNANFVRIEITTVNKKTCMRIYDDGKGVSLKNLKYGRGFSDAQERVEAFGGSFSLNSMRRAKGFTLQVII